MTQELRDILIIINKLIDGLDAPRERFLYVLIRSKVVVFYRFRGAEDTLKSDSLTSDEEEINKEIGLYCPRSLYTNALYMKDLDHLNTIANRINVIDELLAEL